MRKWQKYDFLRQDWLKRHSTKSDELKKNLLILLCNFHYNWGIWGKPNETHFSMSIKKWYTAHSMVASNYYREYWLNQCVKIKKSFQNVYTYCINLHIYHSQYVIMSWRIIELSLESLRKMFHINLFFLQLNSLHLYR